MPELTLEFRRVFKAYRKRKPRFSIMVAHRRCGKTVATVQDLILKAATLQLQPGWGPGRYAYVAPLYSQGKEIAWDYLQRFAAPIMVDKNVAELWVQLFNGSKIRIHGADNPDRLRGGYLDGAVLDEYADMRPSVLGTVIRPMLADRKGWLSLIGTPKGRNEFHRVWEKAQNDPRWFWAMLRASETGILDQEEMDDAARDMTPEEYAQEFECSFDAAIKGAYYGEDIAQLEREGRIREVLRHPDFPLYAAWDLGQSANGMMIVWTFQVVLGEIRVLDCLAGHGKKLEWYVKELEARGWGDNRTDWLPHDAAVHELGTGKTRIEMLGELGCKIARVPRLSIADGISATRKELQRVWFNKETTAEGVEALRQYRTAYDEKRKAFDDTPNRDWTTDYADAFRYLCIASRELSPLAPEKPIPVGIPLPELTMDEFFDFADDRGEEKERV